MTGTLMLMSVHLVLVVMVVVVGVSVSRVMFCIVAGVVGVMSAGPVMFVSVHLVLVIMVVVVGVSVAFVMLLIVPWVVRVMRAVRGTMVVSVTMFVRVVFVFMPFMVVGIVAMIMCMVIVRERFAQLHVSLLVTPDDRGNQNHRHQQQLPNLGALLEHFLSPPYCDCRPVRKSLPETAGESGRLGRGARREPRVASRVSRFPLRGISDILSGPTKEERTSGGAEAVEDAQ